jgi:hypothetical protein
MGRSNVALLALVLGCAATARNARLDDRAERRVTLHYANGAGFELEHRDAFARIFDPTRPSQVTDGTLSGQVCGAGVQLDAQWFSGTLTLTGFGDIQWRRYPRNSGPATLTLGISEVAPGRRKISGQFGGHIYPDRSSPIVDLDVSAERLEGQVESRHFSLTAEGDSLVGRVRDPDGGDKPGTPFAIYGRNVLATMAPADEAYALLALLSCSGLVVTLDDKDIPGFALTKLPRPTPVAEADEVDVVDGGTEAEAEPEPPADVRRTIDPANAAAAAKVLSEYNGRSATVYLPKNPTDEMKALADSVAEIFKRAGLTVEQQTWLAGSCKRHRYDLALIAGQPATPLQLAVAVRLTVTKLQVYACQSANGDPERIGVLVLPPHR